MKFRINFAAVQQMLEHQTTEKIEMLVFSDLTDLKQSNIGVEDAFVNTTGHTKIVGNKIFVYFNGDHTQLRSQIREGIASVYLDAMLFGSTLQEIVQNAVMMNLPEWFKQGLTSYIGEYWNTETDNLLRDALLTLAGPAWELSVDDLTRQVCFSRHGAPTFLSANPPGTATPVPDADRPEEMQP